MAMRHVILTKRETTRVHDEKMWKDEEAQEKQKLAHDGYCGHFDFGYLKMQRMSAPKKKN